MLDTSKIYTSKKYGKYIVVEYKNYSNVTIEFIKTSYRYSTRADCVKSGNVKDRLFPTVYGVGFLGVGQYKSMYDGKPCKAYESWINMLERCYSTLFHKKNPTYTECEVCPEWHNFQLFSEWFHKNKKKGFELDKDVKIDGNKVYSPSACSFVSPKNNRVKAAAKYYSFISPKLNLVKIYNLSEFCRLRSLDVGRMSSVHSGASLSHKGWVKA